MIMLVIPLRRLIIMSVRVPAAVVRRVSVPVRGIAAAVVHRLVVRFCALVVLMRMLRLCGRVCCIIFHRGICALRASARHHHVQADGAHRRGQRERTTVGLHFGRISEDRRKIGRIAKSQLCNAPPATHGTTCLSHLHRRSTTGGLTTSDRQGVRYLG